MSSRDQIISEFDRINEKISEELKILNQLKSSKYFDDDLVLTYFIMFCDVPGEKLETLIEKLKTKESIDHKNKFEKTCSDLELDIENVNNMIIKLNCEIENIDDKIKKLQN